jgi:type 1 fimbria pilin
MMKMMKLTISCAALALFAAGALAQATSGGSATGSGTGGAHAAAFRCGGVGTEDQQRMKSEAAQHALMLTFATTGGAYLADVDVEIHRGGQVVLQGHCGGPIMLVDLAPAGSYEITATSQGRTQKKSVTLGGKPASATFTWPAS